jgi:hypothetical protein
VERAPTTEHSGAVRRSQRQTGFLILLVLAAAVLALPLLFYTFWVLLEAVAKTWHIHRGTSIFSHLLPNGLATVKGWPFDGAFFLSTFAAWGVLFLGYDRFALHGNTVLRNVLQRKAEALLERPLPPQSFFVELRPDAVDRSVADLAWKPDFGWLLVEPDGVRFVGDSVLIDLSRDALTTPGRRPMVEGGYLGLAPSWVRLPVAAGRRGSLRILVRDEVTYLSDTGDGAARLLATLKSAIPATTRFRR